MSINLSSFSNPPPALLFLAWPSFSSKRVYSVATYAPVGTQGKNLSDMQATIEFLLNQGKIWNGGSAMGEAIEGDTEIDSWTVGGKRQKSNYNFNMRCVLNVCWCQFWLSMCNMQLSTWCLQFIDVLVYLYAFVVGECARVCVCFWLLHFDLVPHTKWISCLSVQNISMWGHRYLVMAAI